MASFGLLGPLLADVSDTGAARLPPKHRIILASLLLSANHVVALDRLIHALWDDPPKSARITAQGYVKSLRHLLADDSKSRIMTAEPGYLIVVRDGELDLHAFRRLRDAGQAAARNLDWVTAAAKLRAALRLWRGEPLLDVPSSALLRDEVPALTETRLQAFELWADAELALGRHAELAAQLRRLVAAYPLREKFHAQLMLAQYRCGLHAEAIGTYQRLRRLLAGELGIDPGPDLRELHQRMLTGDPGLRAATYGGPAVPGGPAVHRGPAVHGGPAASAAQDPPRQLPAAVPDFTGREPAIKRLLGLREARGVLDGGPGLPDDAPGGTVRICVITGTGGVGKTTLAVQAGHQLAASYPDGQLYACLRDGGAAVSPGIVLGHFLSALGLPAAAMPADDTDRAARFRTMLAGRRMLVVLDDAEDSSQVIPLLPGSRGSAVIITSRRSLPELAGADRILLDVLDPDEARGLFGAIVGEDRAAREPDMVPAVLGYCGGLPLAVRIAATRLATRPAWSIAALAARLADERGRLTELAVGQLAVRPSFAISYQALRGSDPHAAAMFVLLGKARMASVCLDAATALSGRAEDETRRALEVLADAYLVESTGSGRYGMHDLTRIYAAELADQTGQAVPAGLTEPSVPTEPSALDQAIRRMLEWYCERAIASGQWYHAGYLPPDASPAFTFGTARQAVQWCDTELANLATATLRAADLGLHDLAARIPAALCWFFHRYPHHREWLAIHQAGLASARQAGDAYSEGFMLHTLGEMHAAGGRFEIADDCFSAALTIRRALGDAPGLGRLLNSMGVACLASARPQQALTHLEQALAIAGEHGNRTEAAVTTRNMAEAFCQLSKYLRATDSADRAISLFRQSGERYGEGLAELTAGQILQDAGRLASAVTHHKRALAILSEAGPDDVARASVLCKLADAYAGLGYPSPQAHDALREALAIYDRYRDPRAAVIRARLTAASPVPAISRLPAGIY